MMNRFFFIFLMVFTSTVFGQNNLNHKVVKGETIIQIAQKYHLTPEDILQLNPDSKKGLKPDSIILIPVKNQPKKSNPTTVSHKVEPKETLYGIQNKYGLTEDELKKANPDLEKKGLQIGQTLSIPSHKIVKAVAADKVLYHEVLPKETKYSIAKQYKITIQELENRNPEIIPNLPVGYQLIIKGNVPKPNISTIKTEQVQSVLPIINYIDYEVKPKETLFSLSKMSGLSQDELLLLNPSLSNGVEIGMHIKIPETAKIPTTEEVIKKYTTLTKSSNDRKKIVLLLPFNLQNFENLTTSHLKTDKFLNMTLDFYSGALVAIDSARSIGIPVDFSIYDSQETKNSSNILSIHQKHNLSTANAIIGPFYQTNVEKTAELLSSFNVPVISPLSKDTGNSYPNLYQSIPRSDDLKKALFDYMISKNGNIIAVIDKKKESAKQYIVQNYSQVQIVTLLENGNLSTDNLKKLFVTGKTNYVVLASENTNMIKSTMAAMMNARSSYNLQLVIMEPNETLDTEEIDFENLTKLKLMYPSITGENNSPEAQMFVKEYKKKNKITPNTYATRGFDLTFDTLMRLSQGVKFEETINTKATEQVENRFEFYKNTEGGYINKGVYILNYDTDLIIKEAN